MFGCFGLILTHLGRFWVGIADCGAHQSWIGSILVKCRWCLGATPAVYQCLLLRCVLVALGRACICVILCLQGILLVLRWHLGRTFGDACAVSCLWVSCWHGVFWLRVGGMWALIWGVLHLRARTHYTTSNNPARLWRMTSPAFSGPYRQSLHREKAACVECHEVNKCTSHPKPKKRNTASRLYIFQGGCVF